MDAASDNCPDENLLLAHHDGALVGDEAATVGNHLGECARCRHLLALLDGESAGEAAPVALGRHRLTVRLGQGGMGEVWRAHDPELDRDVAIKLVRRGLDDDPLLHRALVREARLLASITHPNLVQVFDVGQTDHHTWIAMELCEGTSLAAALTASVPWSQRLAWLLDVAAAVEAAHHVGVIHRDLKPLNVLLRADGRIAVTDFGIAVRREHAGSSTGGVTARSGGGSGSTSVGMGTGAGTPVYMAPEQHRGDPVDVRSDVYALCVMGWQMLCGGLPFAGDTSAALLQAKQGGVPPDAEVGDAPRAVVAVLRRGLAARPEDRWPSVGALAAALRRGGSGARTTLIAVTAAAAGVLGLAATLPDRAPRCVEPQALLERWQRAAPTLARAVDATRPSVLRPASERLDRYASDWSRAWSAACEAGSTAQRACIEASGAPLAAIIDGVLADDAALAYRIDAAIAELPPLSGCDDLAQQAGEFAWQRERVAAIASSRVAARLGRYDEAIAAIEPLLEQSEAQPGPGRAAVRVQHAAVVWTRGDPQAAAPIADAAWQAAIDEGDDATAADAAALLARTHAIAGRPEQAQSWLRHAETHAQRTATAPTEDLDRAAVLVHHAAGALELAQAAGERALARLGDAPERAWDRATARNDLANVAIGLRRLDAARSLLRAGLDELQPVFGPGHPQAAVLEATLAVVEMRAGRLDEAAAALHSADAVLARTLDPGQGMRRTVAMNLATLELARGRWAAGREALLPLLDGATGSTERGMLLSNLGIAELELGSHDAARSRFEDVLALRRGPDAAPGAVAEVFGHLGLVDVAQGRWDDAVAHFEEAIERYDAVGDGNPSVSHPLVGLARAEIGRGHPERAAPLLVRALTLREAGGFTPAEIAEVRALLDRAHD